jgi:MSHA pilin protein MshA
MQQAPLPSPRISETTEVNEQAGLSLIELVALLVILALLGAMAVPRFSDMQEEALMAARQRSSIAVKVAHSVATTRLQALPNVSELADFVAGETSATPVANGIRITVNGEQHLVPTFTDSTCSSETSSVRDRVACVGSAQ